MSVKSYTHDLGIKRKFAIGFLVLLWALSGCNLPQQRPAPAECEQDPVITTMLSKTTLPDWLDWVEKLSGAKPVQIGGEPVKISTRYSYAMFTGQANARAFDYVLEQVRAWYPDSQIEIEEYPYTDAERTYTWKNLIVTIPGQTRPQESVILSAHLDDTVVKQGDALKVAPGADDNAVGVAALLEAARIFRANKFERTIRLIWFSGEEEGSAGSMAYVNTHSMAGVVGNITLDMFGYDNDGDRCLEIHAGALPESDRIGRCFQNTAKSNGINLNYDYLTTGASDRSDHASFWKKSVGSVVVIENFIQQNIPGGCKGIDVNPNYHRPGDKVEALNQGFAFDIVRAGLATTASLARPLRQAYPLFPWLTK